MIFTITVRDVTREHTIYAIVVIVLAKDANTGSASAGQLGRGMSAIVQKADIQLDTKSLTSSLDTGIGYH